MKAVISGQSGFIGSHLHQALLSRKYSVARITQEVLYSPNNLKAFFKEEQPDYIFHLASYGNHNNQTDRAMTIFSNIIGTYNMLDASLDIAYKAFFYFSSSSVRLPHETFYSAAKASAERIIRAFINVFDKPIITIRPFSIYGPGEADFRFIPTIIRSIETKQKMALDPDPMHDWIYIDDMIDALIFLLTPKHITYAKGQRIQIGTGEQATNIGVAEMLREISGKELKYEFERNMRPYDTKFWKADTAFMNTLGWKTKVSLEEGLRKTYQWHKEKYE